MKIPLLFLLLIISLSTQAQITTDGTLIWKIGDRPRFLTRWHNLVDEKLL